MWAGKHRLHAESGAKINKDKSMKQYKLVNNVLGWLAFLVAAVVYCSTIEPTASFWDCPEFITTGYKLEVGHPPGAPFFMLTANLFSLFASDTAHVAMMVNTMSALLSAVTILFLFWSITHLTRKLILKDWESLTTGKLIAIQASGLVGALIYTFSDTFWFSAVEGEVYAYSSALTAVVFWLILKWEDQADAPHSDRWLVLIAYITGISVGVHLLNLLCIPAIVLVYCYRRYPNIEVKGSLLALLISFVVVAAVLYGAVPGIITVGGWFELFFVNVLKCPFNTGTIIYIILLVATVVWAIFETYTDKDLLRQNIAFTASVAMLGVPFYGYGWKAAITGFVVLAVLYFVLTRKKKVEKKFVSLVSARVKNTILLCMLMFIIGYSSYAVIVIRSSANTPMDQNSPEDIFTLGSYLSREQYGDKPLFYGQAYSSQLAYNVTEDGHCIPKMKKGAPVWQRKEKSYPGEKDSYFVVTRKDKYVYAQNMVFPRMHDDAHTANYERWMGTIDTRDVPYDRCGEPMIVKIPTQLENLRYFFSYQCNFMYWRYFMWNFAGRQNDILSHGEPEYGNWITGFKFIDNWMLGDQDKLPTSLKENKGHNVFYCMPLLLGIIGLLWQAWRGRRGVRQFWVVFFLFFMTGLAIILYLNQTPLEPRERDYAYAASFYAFAIWCGMGVAAITDRLKKWTKGNETVIAAIVAVVCLIVPIQMASQTWDDHDRSNRYTCSQFGRNYLMSLPDEGYPIIFTNGDNDTFPLWYNQEVEEQRLDARVCNLSYLQTDWYIDQMKRPAYDSPSLPISWSRLYYCNGTNDYARIDANYEKPLREFYAKHPEEARRQFGDDPFEVKNVMKYWLCSPDESMHLIPSDTLYITIDKDAVRRSGMLMAEDSIPDKMVISLAGMRYIDKSKIMLMELIANCNWERPLYIATTVGESFYMNLGENLVQEGMAYRITPFKTKNPGAKNFDVDRAYDNVMNRFEWGNLKCGDVYLDETNTRMVYTHRYLVGKLALALIDEDRKDDAKKLLEKVATEMPASVVPMTYRAGATEFARAYIGIGDTEKAREVIESMWTDAKEYAEYYISLRGTSHSQPHSTLMQHLMAMQNAVSLMHQVDDEQANIYEEEINATYQSL